MRSSAQPVTHMEFEVECEAVFQRATALAHESGHPAIQPHHLARAALESGQIVRRLLNRCGSSPEQFIVSIEKHDFLAVLLPDRGGMTSSMSKLSSKAVKNAQAIASELDDAKVTPEHLFLGACNVGVMDFVLGEHNLTLSDLRESLAAVRRADRGSTD